MMNGYRIGGGLRFAGCLTATHMLLVCCIAALGQDTEQPKAIPQTRSEMKAALDRLKSRPPRLPMPAPTEEEIQNAQSGGGGIVNNGRMRSLYLPKELTAGGFTRQPDPNMTLDNAFAVKLFWIASRVNNCHYCLGHQEVKLIAAGVPEDDIAALDCAWDSFSESERAAFAFAKKLTHEPHQVGESDLELLRKHFDDSQILEMIFLVSRYNATNRWTDSLGIPQERARDLLTATDPRFISAPSQVALGSVPTPRPVVSRAQLLRALADCQTRKPRFDLISAYEAQTLVESFQGADAEDFTPQWMRLLGRFPVAGLAAMETYQRGLRAGQLDDRLKAEIAWVAARHDRAWYALGHAGWRLAQLGVPIEEILDLDASENKDRDPRDVVRAFTVKLTEAPQSITDSDIARLRTHFNDHQVAEIVFHVTQAALLDRLSEAANLQLEMNWPQ